MNKKKTKKQQQDAYLIIQEDYVNIKDCIEERWGGTISKWQ